MLTNERPNLQTPWMLATTRWIFVVAMALALAMDPRRVQHSRYDLLSLDFTVVAIVAANVVLVILQAIGWQARLVTFFSVGFDALSALLLYVFYGGASSPLLFYGLLPVVTCALRFDVMAGLVCSIVMATGFVAVSILTGTGDVSVLLAGSINAVLVILGGGALTWAAGLARQRLYEVRAQADEDEQRRMSRARERARAIYDMASTLSATLNYEKVLETALDVSEIGMGEGSPRAERMVAMVMLFKDDELQMVASRHLSRTDKNLVIGGEGSIVGGALRSAEVVLADDASRDEDLRQIIALQDCRSIACLPLRAGFENYGVMLFASPMPAAFGEEQLELFNAVANQATIALQNARLYQSLLEEKERIISVDEDARKKLARDLHDGPTQNVAAIAMRTNFTLRVIEKDPSKAGEELRKIEELARQTTREMRHMLFTLRPLVLESQGLSAALQQLGEKMRETYNLNVIVETTPFEHKVDAAKQGVAFYIVEEALGNARKHAQSQHIWVRLGLRGDLFIVQIEDDGVGFEVAAVDASYDRRGSLGMLNMRERAALVNGTLHVQSAPGKGTRITVAVPLSAQAQEQLEHGGNEPLTPPPAPVKGQSQPLGRLPAAPPKPAAQPPARGATIPPREKPHAAG